MPAPRRTRIAPNTCAPSRSPRSTSRQGEACRGISMAKDDLIAIENYRRFLRPDWRRWLPGDPERGLTPEQIKAQRHDFMLRDLAFETPLARRLRKEAEERAQIEQARLEREHREEIER